MRRLLLIAVIIALVAAAFAGVASARLASAVARPTPVLAPFRAAAAMPIRDAGQPGAWGFRTSREIAQDMAVADADASSPPAAANTGAAVTVTATVLPVVIIVIDRDGDVRSLTTNTEARDAAAVLYLVRLGSTEGPARRLNRSIWSSARGALLHARAGTGTVWTA